MGEARDMQGKRQASQGMCKARDGQGKQWVKESNGRRKEVGKERDG